MPAYDIARIIKEAKLGGARKDAQIDACEPFAAALFDVLTAAGIKAKVYAATFYIEGKSSPEWAHAVVKVGDRYYDSLGEFNHDIVRKHIKIHKKVSSKLSFKEDNRDFDENDWSEMHAFCLKALTRSIGKIARQK